MRRTLAWGLLALAAAATGSTGCATSAAAPAARAKAGMVAVRADRAAERAGGTVDAAGPLPEVPSDRKVIRSADLRLAVDDFDEAGRAIVALAERSGGFVLSASEKSYQVKVPARAFDDALEALAALGEVEHRRIYGQDVTAEYLDLEARLRTAEKARAAYLELLSRAATVEEMLKVEQALAGVQERIETLLGRKKYLDEHLALSTLTVTLVEHHSPGPLKLLWDGASWLVTKLWWI